MSTEVQDIRYEHFETKRTARLEEWKAKRKELIEEEGQIKAASKHHKNEYCTEACNTETNWGNTRTQTISNWEKDTAKWEWMKKQQLGEIKNAIEYEYSLWMLRKKGEEKLKQQKEKEERLREEQEEAARIKAEKQRKKEMERLQKEREEEREKMEKFKEAERRDKEKAETERLKREEIEKENWKTAMLQEEKRREWKEKWEKNAEYQKKWKEEQWEAMQRKEQERKKQMEAKRDEQQKQTQINQWESQKRVERALKRSEAEWEQIRSNYEIKRMHEEEQHRLKEQENERLKAEKQKKIEERDKKILQVLHKNEEFQSQKWSQYQKRQEEAEKVKLQKEIEKREKIKQQKMEIAMQEKKIIETLRKNETAQEHRKRVWLEKFYKSEWKIQRQREENMKTMTQKFVTQSCWQEDSSENIRKFERQMEFKKQLKIEEMENRRKRIAEYQKAKLEISEQKKKLQDLLVESKRRKIEKMNKWVRSGKFTTKEEWYQQVFTEEELNNIKMNRTVNDDSGNISKIGHSQWKNKNKNKMKPRSHTVQATEDKKHGYNDHQNENQGYDFFWTQGQVAGN